jgi:antitoxin (DNA-binding transcriptional repressor) of toxin-antitoxin stability system
MTVAELVAIKERERAEAATVAGAPRKDPATDDDTGSRRSATGRDR